MWIHHIGEIAIGAFVLLIAVHFGLHFMFKAQRAKKGRQQNDSQPSKSDKN